MRTLRRPTTTGTLILAHLLLILAVSPQKGADDLALLSFQVGLALASFLVLALSNRASEADPARWQTTLGAVLVVSGVLFTLFGNTLYGEDRQAMLPMRFVCLPLLAVYFLPNRPPANSILGPVYARRRQVFWVLCGAAVVLRVVALNVSPEPLIDVFWFTNQGAKGLWHGVNPYDRTFHMVDPRSVSLYAYLPGQFIFDTPSALLLGDMRWGQVAAELLAAALLYFIVRGNGRGDDLRRHSAELAVLLLLFFPQALRTQEQAWVEFKQVLAMAAFVWMSLQYPRSPWRFVPLGWLFALKQTAWASIPFLGRIPGIGWRALGIMAATFAVIVVPFVVWNPRAFYEDVVGYHLALPMPRSISLSWTIELATGWEPGLAWLALGTAFVWLYLLARARRSLLGFLTASATLGMFPVLARQGYLNYFYYLDGLVLIALALSLRQGHDARSDRGAGTGTGQGSPRATTLPPPPLVNGPGASG